MSNKKGVTLASLTVYVVLLLVILVIFTFISANFTSQISEIANKGKVSNEYIKVYSFLIADIKSANSVIEYSDNFLRFDNDVSYSIRYLKNRSDDTSQYEIYRNNVLIGENVMDASFDYNDNIVTINLKYLYGKNIFKKSQDFIIGKGY